MITLLISQAFALSCADGVHSIDLTHDFPPNGVLVYSVVGSTPDEPVVYDADGLVVPTTLTDHGEYHTVTPDQPMPAGDYVLQLEGERDFTVAGVDDIDPPAPPGLYSIEVVTTETEWGTDKLRRFSHIPLAPDEHLEIELSESGDFESDAVRVISFQEEPALGVSACARIPSSYIHNISYAIRARIVDSAGNSSDWEEPTEDDSGHVGCSTSNTPAIGLLALFALLGLRRR